MAREPRVEALRAVSRLERLGLSHARTIAYRLSAVKGMKNPHRIPRFWSPVGAASASEPTEVD